MGLKAVNVFLLIALSACLVQTAFGKPKPRDSSVVEEQRVVPLSNEATLKKHDISPKSEATTEGTHFCYDFHLTCKLN